MTSIEFDEIVNSVLFPPPRLVCLCEEFKPNGKVEKYTHFYQCQCGGWKSLLVIMEEGNENNLPKRNV